MFELVINKFAEDTLNRLSARDKKNFLKIVNALDEIEIKGEKSSNTRLLKNTNGVFRKRTGRWRILFTLNGKTIDIWIIAVEKNTHKDYKKWINYISYHK